ncbi:MAG: DNA cytosine methyltransferase [Gammaproteobacteria bacterium]|nr:DNA cytosine methyltransferase [Gammaproteobacteria bacterium]
METSAETANNRVDPPVHYAAAARVRAPRRTFLSLFSGCGGLDSGFHELGFRCIGAFDRDSLTVATYNQNFGDSQATTFDLRQWRSLSTALKPDVIVAGSPCQGFSPIGEFDSRDPRNPLLLVPILLGIRQRTPLIMIENVPGVAMNRHSSIWRRAHHLLGRAGYHVRVATMNAADLGAPQLRRRVILMASLTPIPTLSFEAKPGTTIESVLDATHIQQPELLRRDSRSWKIARRIRQGQKLCNVRNGPSAVHTWNIPDVFGEVSTAERKLLEEMIGLRRRHRVRDHGDADPVRLAILRTEFGPRVERTVDGLVRRGYLRQPTSTTCDLRHTFNGKYRRLSATAPSHAVLTNFCDPSHFLHPHEDRGFTPREAARIQSFPDDFVFLGSPDQQARLIGNAVPPVVSSALAKWASDSL